MKNLVNYYYMNNKHSCYFYSVTKEPRMTQNKNCERAKNMIIKMTMTMKNLLCRKFAFFRAINKKP